MHRNYPQRAMWGERNGSAKLTARQVTHIRRLWLLGVSQKGLAELYGVRPQTVNAIVRDETWTHIPWPIVDKQTFVEQVLGVAAAGVAASVQLGALSLLCVAAMGPRRLIWDLLFSLPWLRHKRRPKPMFIVRTFMPTPTPTPEPSAGALAVPPTDEDVDVEPLPLPLKDWAGLHLVESEVVRVDRFRSDRSRHDEDVQMAMASKRFHMLIGGRSRGGPGDERRRA